MLFVAAWLLAERPSGTATLPLSIWQRRGNKLNKPLRRRENARVSYVVVVPGLLHRTARPVCAHVYRRRRMRPIDRHQLLLQAPHQSVQLVRSTSPLCHPLSVFHQIGKPSRCPRLHAPATVRPAASTFSTPRFPFVNYARCRLLLDWAYTGESLGLESVRARNRIRPLSGNGRVCYVCRSPVPDT
jgi:hypothetical protein